jgi:glycosyltransferase involved in cell wall biosynthesis
MLQAYGVLSSPHSWAFVMQALLLEFQKKGVDLVCKSTNGVTNIPPSLKVVKLDTVLPQTDVSFSYTLPINLHKVNAQHRVVIANYDNTKMPSGWAQMYNNYAHLILPSSKFAYDILKENGVLDQRMVVVPHGYDPTIYHPNVQRLEHPEIPKDKFIFLCVAAPHWRKNIEGLLEAYIQEFQGNQDTCLIIKSSMNSGERGKAHFFVDLNDIIKRLKNKYKFTWPDVKLITTPVQDLASLYKAANALVLASKTECFSLTVLEAANCKLPIITTEYGGHLDFLNHDNSYLIDYVLKQSPKEGQYHIFTKDSYIAEPNHQHLRQLLRHVRDNYEEAQQKAELAYQQTKHLTWENAASQILDLIKERGWKI